MKHSTGTGNLGLSDDVLESLEGIEALIKRGGSGGGLDRMKYPLNNSRQFTKGLKDHVDTINARLNRFHNTSGIKYIDYEFGGNL